MSEIFRDGNFLAFSKVSFEDFEVSAPLQSEHEDATLSVKITLNSKAKAKLQLLDAIGKTMASASQTADPITTFSIPVGNHSKCTAETPSLYQQVLFT